MIQVARLRIFFAWTALLTFAGIAAWQGRIGSDVRLFQLAYVIGFGGYAIIAYDAWRRRSECSAWTWRMSLLGCIALRGILLPTMPSDDIYRYAWEGRIQNAGFNPYTHAPDDPALQSLRNEYWQSINHPNYPAIYGPVAQIQFRLITRFTQDLSILKGIQVLWDLLTVMVLGACLKRMGQNPLLALLYGLNPLVLTTFGVEGHLDSLLLLGIALLLWSIQISQPLLTGAFLGLAIGVKVAPLILLPWFLFRQFRTGVVAILTCCACYLPFVDAGTELFGSLARFGGGEMFFSPIALLNDVLGIESSSILQVQRAILALALGAMLLYFARNAATFHRYAYVATYATLIVSPITHYWYVTWILVLLPFQRRVDWIVMSLALVTYFEASRIKEITGQWSMPTWSPAVAWGGLLLTVLIHCGLGSGSSYKLKTAETQDK